MVKSGLFDPGNGIIMVSGPIPETNAGARMVQALRSGVVGSVKGRVTCAVALDQPQHWQE